MDNQTTKHPNSSIWWRHRRKMAYMSLAWTLVQTFLWAALEFINPGFIQSSATVVGWSYGTASTVILGYFGNTAVDTYRNKL